MSNCLLNMKILDLVYECNKENIISGFMKKLNIPVLNKDMCVVLKKEVAIFTVKDVSVAMTALFEHAVEKVNILIQTSNKTSTQIVAEVIKENFLSLKGDYNSSNGVDMKELDGFLDKLHKAHIYICDNGSSIEDEVVQKTIVNADINVIVTD